MFLVGCCVFFHRLVAAGLFVIIVEDVAVLAVLVVVIFVALVVAITLPFCPCTVVRRPITFPPQSRPRVFGWLSREKNERLIGHVAVLAVLVVVIFVTLVVAIALPKRFRTVVRPIPSPLRHARLFLVGC